jgi:copper chaperone CopZ
MTKVEAEFQLSRSLDASLLECISAAHSLYGMYRVRLSPDMRKVLVEYDASRLTPAQVESALHRAGIPAARI